MHLEIQSTESGPGGTDQLLVRLHGRLTEAEEGGLVVRIDGHSYALVPIEDDKPAVEPDEGELASAALVLPAGVLSALSKLGDDTESRRRPSRRGGKRPAAADLTRLGDSFRHER
jgi:hypothetical protein